jgi:hypothetical protein
MKEHELSVVLTLAGPVLSRATAAGEWGVDAPMARDRDGRALLPGTLVKGRLREAWTALSVVDGNPLGLDTVRIADWLGIENADGAWEPSRGRLYLSDFTAEGSRSGLRHRVQIDEGLGAVRQQAFQTVETPFAPGEEVAFRGTARFVPRDVGEPEAIRSALAAGLRWVAGFGALRSIGFGRTLRVEVSAAREASGAVTSTPGAEAGDGAPGEGSLRLALTPGAPFCLAEPQPVQNLFRSSSVLAGGALKGALASTWRERLGLPPSGPVVPGMDPDRPELCEHFHQVRFTHGLPTLWSSRRRPLSPPLSLAKVPKTEALFDLLDRDGPVLLRDNHGAWRAPLFAIDWKESAKVEAAFGWPRLDRELRVRTAIDSERQRAASEQLFAQELVVPAPEVAWLASVDLGAIEDTPARDRVRGQLRELLLGGLRGLGKTKAPVAVALLPPAGDAEAWPRRGPASGEEPWRGRHSVLLQTPALLCDPEGVFPDRDVASAYDEVWKELSGGALRLVRFFARQSLAGGEYLHRRFLGGDVYRPFLLTEPGSVFLLAAAAGREPDAARCVELWECHGLPLPAWAEERYRRSGRAGGHWENCPYIRENGYGEVVVDLACHVAMAPGPDEHRRVRPVGGAS